MTATLDELHNHVIDDAKELLETIGVVRPLIVEAAPEVAILLPADMRVEAFLRSTLARNLALILTRIHAERPVRREKTGATASIVTMLAAAVREGRLAEANAQALLDVREALKDRLRAAGVEWADLVTFRTAEISHSLHRASRPADGTLTFSALVDFAYGTYELLIAIERAIGRDGVDLDNWYHDSLNRGSAYWQKRRTETGAVQ